MKWVGQHIYDLIARFRNAVYLEGLTNPGPGTLKHLVLDTNNKIRFRTSAETLSDIGATGDITAVVFTTDSGASDRHSVDSGSANFSFLGSSGVGVTNSNEVLTFTAVPGEIDHDSLLNFEPNEHIDWTGASAGTIHSTNIPTLNQDTTGTAAGLSSTLSVSSGGTGQTTLTSDSLLTGNGTSGITAESNLTYDGTNLKITDSGLGAPDIIIESTASHSSAGNLIFQKLRDDNSPADGGSIGTVSFNGEDTGLNTQIYGQIVGIQEETGAGTEGGKIKIRVATHDGELQDGIVVEDGSAEDEIDVTIGNTTTSLTTIAGDLQVNGNDIKDSGGNTIMSSDGSGVVTMAGGNIAVGGSNANLNMNSGSDIILEADNAGGGNTSTIQYLDAGGTNRIILGADSDVAILSNRASNGTVQIRANSSTAGGSGEVTVVTVEDDKVTISQDLHVSGNVLPGITYVKILPSDFMPDDVGRPAMIDDTSSDRWLESHSTAKLYAYVDIPVGFKATHVDIYGSGTSAVTVYEADVNSKTVTSKGTGNIGTQINITDVNSDATNYILIELAQASGEEVYGGKLTIAKI